MIKIKNQKEKKKSMAKTQPDERLSEIRISLSDPVKQKLMEISTINNHLNESQTKDWTYNQDHHSPHRLPQTQPNTFYREHKPISKAHQLRKFSKTQTFSNSKDDQSKICCNAVTMQFQAMLREKQTRIHSGGQANFQFDNSTFHLSEKLLKQSAYRSPIQLNKTQHLFYNKYARLKEISERKPIIGARKNVSKFIVKQKQDFSVDKIKDSIENELIRRKEFLDLTSYLLEERNIFYPVKEKLKRYKTDRNYT